MHVLRKEPLRRATGVGEIAASATGNQDFLARLARVVHHQHAAPAPGGGHRAHQSGGAGAYDQDVVFFQGVWEVTRGEEESKQSFFEKKDQKTFAPPHLQWP